MESPTEAGIDLDMDLLSSPFDSDVAIPQNTRHGDYEGNAFHINNIATSITVPRRGDNFSIPFIPPDSTQKQKDNITAVSATAKRDDLISIDEITKDQHYGTATFSDGELPRNCDDNEEKNATAWNSRNGEASSCSKSDERNSSEEFPENEGTDQNDNSTENGDASIQDYRSMSSLVESWREELNMLNVKNSILLDDLVKVGADV